jgi:hypothetical protein
MILKAALQFAELCSILFKGVIPKAPRFHQRGESLP